MQPSFSSSLQGTPANPGSLGSIIPANAGLVGTPLGLFSADSNPHPDTDIYPTPKEETSLFSMEEFYRQYKPGYFGGRLKQLEKYGVMVTPEIVIQLAYQKQNSETANALRRMGIGFVQMFDQLSPDADDYQSSFEKHYHPGSLGIGSGRVGWLKKNGIQLTQSIASQLAVKAPTSATARAMAATTMAEIAAATSHFQHQTIEMGKSFDKLVADAESHFHAEKTALADCGIETEKRSRDLTMEAQEGDVYRIIHAGQLTIQQALAEAKEAADTIAAAALTAAANAKKAKIIPQKSEAEKAEDGAAHKAKMAFKKAVECVLILRDALLAHAEISLKVAGRRVDSSDHSLRSLSQHLTKKETEYSAACSARDEAGYISEESKAALVEAAQILEADVQLISNIKKQTEKRLEFRSAARDRASKYFNLQMLLRPNAVDEAARQLGIAVRTTKEVFSQAIFSRADTRHLLADAQRRKENAERIAAAEIATEQQASRYSLTVAQQALRSAEEWFHMAQIEIRQSIVTAEERELSQLYSTAAQKAAEIKAAEQELAARSRWWWWGASTTKS